MVEVVPEAGVVTADRDEVADGTVAEALGLHKCKVYRSSTLYSAADWKVATTSRSHIFCEAPGALNLTTVIQGVWRVLPSGMV